MSLGRLGKLRTSELRVAEEYLRSDLDVAGLRAQVPGRIEELPALGQDAGR